MDQNQLSFIPLGGIGDVTKNMYLYEYGDNILIVDCGIGFADETMLGVDLLLPDISYLLQTKKKIIGLLLTHGHEDHIGALPFVLPQLIGKHDFPMLATPLTAALANEKLEEYGVEKRVTPVEFDKPEVVLGDFTANFIRITHSVPDTSNIFIKTPVGNFYHGSDFKFDLTPVDGKPTDFGRIAKTGEEGVRCLLSDCLGANRQGHTPSEQAITENFEKEIALCRGKFVITTYSSNISRLNQAISVAQKFGRKVCFVGRSLVKAREVAQNLGYMQLATNLEIKPEQVKQFSPEKLLLIVAGSQGQENSALTRIANGDHRDITLQALDVVVFSADPIPGNETSVHSLIDTIAKRGTRVVYSESSDDFHVSGHGSIQDLLLMISLTKPKTLLPIGGTYRHMVAYQGLAQQMGYKANDVVLPEDGQEVIFTKEDTKLGRKFNSRNIYVDQITGEEVESFILRDRQKLSEAGVVIVMVEIDSATSQIVDEPDVIARGFAQFDNNKLRKRVFAELKGSLQNKKGRVTNWVYIRKLLGEITEKFLFKEFRARPLVLPIVIEV